MKKSGIIQVYTGNGKGKTTAAVGQAVRARARGYKVAVIFFFKLVKDYKGGEAKALKKLGIDCFGFACQHPHHYKNVSLKKLKLDCYKAVQFIEKQFKLGKYDMLVLDELNIAVRDKFLCKKELLDLIAKKPRSMDVVITGRSAPKALIKVADTVTELKKIKHHYDSGITVRKGIEC